MSAPVDAVALAFRQRNAVRALVPLFVFSGATSLVYQTLWVRQLHLVVGTSQLAVATVLAAFMTGLAAGGFLGGRFADTAKKPILIYAVLEALIGIYALVFPFLLDLVEPVYLEFWRANEPSPGTFFAFQFVLLGVLLLPPTTAMGATLPFLARFATSPETHDAQRASTSDAGERVGRLYGANTIGAVVGTGLAGFLFLPQLGLTTTTWLTAGGNVLLCALAVVIATRAGEIAPAPRAASSKTGRKKAGGGFALLAAVAFLAGFSGLVLEVAWFRVLGLNLGGSAYAFSIMLLAFLIGIGTGGWFGGGLADRVFRGFGHAGVLTGLAALELGVAVLTWGTMYAYGELPYLFVVLFDWLEGVDALSWIWPGKLFIALLVTFPAAACMGAAFPFLVRAAADDHDALGGPVGTLYGWNTVGGIFGAGLGSLVLLPQLHVTNTSILAIGLNVLAAMLAIGAAEWTRGRKSLIVGWALAGFWAVGLVAWKPPPWNPLLMTAGMYKYASDLSDRTREGVYAFAVEPYELLFYDEGLSSVVTVAKSNTTGNIWLANNGKVDASTSIDMPTQVLCAQLPFAFHPDAKEAVVIGLASGITAGTVTLNSRLERIDIIELEPAILEASHHFDAFNHRPLDDPRARLYANDGRNHITLVPDGSYDVVVSEPSNPWLSGVSNLFTQEFFALGKKKLKPDGVWSQWVQMYGMNQDDLRTLVKTFASVYPHVRLFSTIEDADLVLIGSDRPLDIDADALARLWEIDEDITFELAGIQIVGPYDLLTRYQLDHDQIMAFAGDVPVNTDDNMRIEYSAPLHLHEDTAEANFQALLGDREERRLPLDAVEGLDGLKELARAYHRRERLVEALVVLKEAYKVAPDDPELGELYDAWQNELLVELEE